MQTETSKTARAFGMQVLIVEQYLKDIEKLAGDDPAAAFNMAAIKSEPTSTVFLPSLTVVQESALNALIDAFPAHTPFTDLMRAVKTREAAQLGITMEQYEALRPLFQAFADADANETGE